MPHVKWSISDPLTRALVDRGVLDAQGNPVAPAAPGLPTAAVGQVLGSRGAGVQPTFSPIVTLLNPAGSADFRRWEIKVSGSDLAFDSQNDAGVSYGRPISISLFNGTVTLPTGAGLVVTAGSISAGWLNLPEVPFTSLPTGQAVGTIANVSDSTVNTLGTTVAGGGTNHVLARWNGTIWKVIGV